MLVSWCTLGKKRLFYYSVQSNDDRNAHLPVVKGPSGMKNAPTVIAVAAANLKNQNLQRNWKENDQIGIYYFQMLDMFSQVHKYLNI